MNKPVIGILGNLLYEQDSLFISNERLYVNAAYPRAVEKNGGVPLLLPVTSDWDVMEQLLFICDGLIFPGGCDVDPKQYGENPHKNLGSILPELDENWLYVAHWALSRDFPILGICRGMQLLNVAVGGTLYQDLDLRNEESFLHLQSQRRDGLLHKVNFQPGSVLTRVLAADCIYTNSMHHQSVKSIGNGFVVSAQTEDNVVEAIESINGMQIGVQWHPEELLQSEPRMNLLFANLCKQALIRKQKER